MSEQAVNGAGVMGHRHAERSYLAIRFLKLEAGKVLDNWPSRMVIGRVR